MTSSNARLALLSHPLRLAKRFQTRPITPEFASAGRLTISFDLAKIGVLASLVVTKGEGA
jgi:hypothetical protein